MRRIELWEPEVQRGRPLRQREHHTVDPDSPPDDGKILMLVDERGSRRGSLAEGQLYEAVRKAIDPTPRGEKPVDSRGPYAGNWRPFP